MKPPDLVLSESSAPGHLLVVGHLLTVSSGGGERKLWSFPLLVRALVPSWRLYPLVSSSLNFLLKAPSPDMIILGCRASLYGFGRGTKTQSIAGDMLIPSLELT